MLLQSKAIIRQSCDFVWRIFINPKTWKEWYGDALQQVTPGWQEDGYLNWKMGSPSRIAEFVPLEKVTLIGSSSSMKTEFTFADAEDGATLVMLQVDYGSQTLPLAYQDAKQRQTNAIVASLKRYVENAAGQPAASENEIASKDDQQEEKKRQTSTVKNKSIVPFSSFIYAGLFLCFIIVGVTYILGLLLDPHGYRNNVLPTCKDTPSAFDVTTDTLSFGNVVIMWYTEESWNNFSPEDFGLQEAKSKDDIDTVICVEELKKKIDECHYDQGAYRYLIRKDWNINVIDWGTKELIATTTLSGSSPTCPEYFGSPDTRLEVIGDEPRGELINWLREFDI